MNTLRRLVAGIAILVPFIFLPPAHAESGGMNKAYEYAGEKFTISKPENGLMAVNGMGLTAFITIHEATGMYREHLKGWGADHSTLKGAVDGACQRILNRVKKPSEAELLKGLDEFYETLR